MDRLFRIDWYPQEWIIDTAQLTLDERGLFVQIVNLIYANRGPIENNPKWIAGVSGCSTRLAISIISRLDQKGFIQLSGGKISQKRTENELKNKREHLELSAKGGRNKAENQRRSKENNDLNSSDDTISVPSPSPSPYPSPTAKDKEDQDPQPLDPPPNLNGFSILKLLGEDGLIDARVFASAALQTVEELARIYDNGVKTGIMKPPRDPDKAFIAWIRSITTKGKKL